MEGGLAMKGGEGRTMEGLGHLKLVKGLRPVAKTVGGGEGGTGEGLGHTPLAKGLTPVAKMEGLGHLKTVGGFYF